MESLKNCLDQIVHIADSEAYDEQARQYMKQWALCAIEKIKEIKDAA